LRFLETKRINITVVKPFDGSGSDDGLGASREAGGGNGGALLNVVTMHRGIIDY
jgi:hypothetical protein